MDHANKVREFTEGSMNIKCPSKPTPMNSEEVRFIIRMVFSEMYELAQTVTNDSVKFLQECLDTIDYSRNVKFNNEKELIGQQFDSFVDAWYYMLNASAKKGVNLCSIFDKVHEANMAKRFSDGTFHRREDGKVIKPDGWKEPDITGEIERQMDQGAWN